MLLDVKIAAERASVCERIVRGWIADGTLPCYRIGSKGSRGTIRIESADLDDLLATFKVYARESKRTTRRKAVPIPKLNYIELN